MKKSKIIFASSYLDEGHKLPKTEQNIVKELRKRQIEVVILGVTQAYYIMSQRHMGVYVGSKNITDADILFIRRTRNAEKESYQLATIMKQLGATVIDTVDSFDYPTQKLLLDCDLYKHLNYPKTSYLPKADKNIFIAMKKMNLRFPVIIKPQAETLGRGVMIINNKQQALNYPLKWQVHGVILQEYLDIKNEYRVLTIGGKSLGATQKTHDMFFRDKHPECFKFVRNKKIEKFAESAVKLLPGDIYGSDVAELDNGKLYLLESNRNPSFGNFKHRSGINIEAKIANFCLTKLKKKK